MASKEKKEKKKASKGSDSDGGGSKKKKERGAKEADRPAPTPEILQALVSAPIALLPVPLDTYTTLIDANARPLLFNPPTDQWTYAELIRNLVTLETSISSLLARIGREYAEPLRQRQSFSSSANTLLFGQIDVLVKISGRLIGVYESSNIGGAVERIRRKLSDMETVYCHQAYTSTQVNNTLFNLEQDKSLDDVLKVDNKPSLGLLLSSLLHYPFHCFALWRRLKPDEMKATSDVGRLLVDLERFTKAMHRQYELGQSVAKLHELNHRLTNPEHANLLAGADLRHLLLVFPVKAHGAKKEAALLSDALLFFKPLPTENKLEYESMHPIAEVQRLEVSPTTNVLRLCLTGSKTVDISPATIDVAALAKLFQKAAPRIPDSIAVLPSLSPREQQDVMVKVEAPKEKSGSHIENKDPKKDKRPVTPSKRAEPPKEPNVLTPAAKLKEKEKDGRGSPMRGASPLRKREGVVFQAGEDEVVLHEEGLTSSDAINTDQEGHHSNPSPGEPSLVKPDKESTGTKEEKEGGWGNMIVSFFKGEQNIAQIKKRTDHSGGSHSPIMINSLDDFPREIKSLLKNTGIPSEKFEKNLTILTNVLYFTTHRNFVTKETKERRRAEKRTSAQNAPLAPSALPEDAPARHFEAEAKAELAKEDNPRRLYKLAQQAGKGGFGKVYDARLAVPNGKRVAVKRMPNSIEKDKNRNITEIGALKLCKHPNIVEFHAAHRVQDEIWLVMEFMEGGTLTEAAKAHNFSEKEIAFVAREILKAIQFLHARSLVHRDLKSSNIMMSTTGDIKLIDFGLCCDIRTCRRGKMAGSPYWMPPEMIARQQYSFPIDIWSMAVCIIELALRSPPNKSNPIKAMFLTATDGIRDPLGADRTVSWSKDIKDFLNLCLQMDPEKRATATQLLTHDLVKKAEDHKNMEKVLSSIFLHNTLAVLGTGFG